VTADNNHSIEGAKVVFDSRRDAYTIIETAEDLAKFQAEIMALADLHEDDDEPR
jgi:hypothetical protein